MSDGATRPPVRPDYEAARRIIMPDGNPVSPEAASPEVVWDKPAPTGPPQPMERAIPAWFKDIYGWFQGIVQDEGLVADICLEKAIAIVQFNHDRGLFGIDLMQEGGQAAGRTAIVAMSVPLSIELYKQVLEAIKARREDFLSLMKKAEEKRLAEAGNK